MHLFTAFAQAVQIFTDHTAQNDYADVFASSVLADNYSDPQASIDTYIAAFADTLDSFRNHDVNDELPRLMAKLLGQAATAGLGDRQINSLVNVLRNG